MAVERRELERSEEFRARPQLRLVPPGPRGRVVPALLFVLLLAGTLVVPVGQVLLRGSPVSARWSPRPLPASEIASLARVRAMPRHLLPRSREPVAGVLFVSCTRLWRALPDGSHRSLVFERPGISSPTLSPGGRTVAFLAPGDEGPEIWMAAADGSETVRIGSVGGDNAPAGIEAMGLSWSPGGAELAFAVTTPGYDPWTGGSAIFTLDLSTGEFDRVASGPVAIWAGSSLGAAQWVERKGPQIVLGRGNRVGSRLSSPEDDLSAAFAPGSFANIWERDVAVLQRSEDGVTKLGVRSTYFRRRRQEVFLPPAGRSFADPAHVSLSEDGAKVFVDLVDRDGELDLGILDVSGGDWTVLDYAWNAAPSPVPTASGPPRARRALDAAGDLLRIWERNPARASLLIGERRGRHLLPFDRMNYVLGKPQRDGDTWIVAGAAFGRSDDGFAYRRLSVAVTAERTRLYARPSASSAITPIATVEDAAGALDEMLDAEIVAPAGLPSGTKLARTPISAYKWKDYENGSIYLRVPTEGARRYAPLTLSYGDVDLALGCGGENDPRPLDLGGTSAMTDHLRRTNAVIWPATPEDLGHADFSVYGDVPKEVVTAVAAAMEART